MSTRQEKCIIGDAGSKRTCVFAKNVPGDSIHITTAFNILVIYIHVLHTLKMIIYLDLLYNFIHFASGSRNLILIKLSITCCKISLNRFMNEQHFRKNNLSIYKRVYIAVGKWN